MKESDVQSVMCSYNLVNGVYACENRNSAERSFQGRLGVSRIRDVRLGRHPQHRQLGAERRLDQEQPENIYFGANLKAAVQAGQVPQSRLDNMVHRILRAMFAAGIFDHPASVHAIDAAADADVAAGS